MTWNWIYLSLSFPKQDDDDFDIDIVPLDGTVSADFTLKMPNNPEAFAKNAKISSTPAWFNSKNGDEITMGALMKGGE